MPRLAIGCVHVCICMRACLYMHVCMFVYACVHVHNYELLFDHGACIPARSAHTAGAITTVDMLLCNS